MNLERRRLITAAAAGLAGVAVRASERATVTDAPADETTATATPAPPGADDQAATEGGVG